MFKSHGTVLSVVLKGISVHGAELLQSVLTQPRRTWCNIKEDINPPPIIHKHTFYIQLAQMSFSPFCFQPQRLSRGTHMLVSAHGCL